MRGDLIGLVVLAVAMTTIFWDAPASANVAGLLDPAEPALGLVAKTALPKGDVAIGTFLLETDEHVYVASYFYANGFAAARNLREDLDGLNNQTVLPVNASGVPAEPPQDPATLLCANVDCTTSLFPSGDDYALAKLGDALSLLLGDLDFAAATDISGEVTQAKDALVIARFARLEGAALKDRVESDASGALSRLRDDTVRSCVNRTLDEESCAGTYVHLSVSATYDTRIFRYTGAARDPDLNIVGPLAWRAESTAAIAGPAVERVAGLVGGIVPAFETLYLPVHVLLVAVLLWVPSLVWNAIARKLNHFPSWPMHLYGTLVLVLVLAAVLFGRVFFGSTWLTLLVPFAVLYLGALLFYAYAVPEQLHGDGFLAGAGAGIAAILVLGHGLFELQNEDLLPGLVTGLLFHDALAIILFGLELAFALALAGSLRAQYLRLRGWLDARRVLHRYRGLASDAAAERYWYAGEEKIASKWHHARRVPTRVAVAFLPRVVEAREELTNVGLAYAKRRRLVLERRIRIRRYRAAFGGPFALFRAIVAEWREWADERGAGLAAEPELAKAARRSRVTQTTGIDLPMGDPAYKDLVAHYAATHDVALQRPLAKAA